MSLRFVARKVLLVGKTEDDFTKADMLLEHSADFFKGRFIPKKGRGGGLKLKMILLKQICF